MALQVWKAAADKVASYIRSNNYSFHRGLLVVPRSQEGILIGWLFGNDNYFRDEQVHRDVDAIRQRLRENAVEELGFGLSPDGYTWVLVLKADAQRYLTAAGKAFHLEMVRELLDEAIEGGGEVSLEICGRPWNCASERPQPAR